MNTTSTTSASAAKHEISEPYRDCIEACQRIARDFADGSFDGVTVGAIEDAVAASKKYDELKSLLP